MLYMSFSWLDKHYPKYGVYGGWHKINGVYKPFFMMAEFRKDPIPRTGLKRGHKGSHYRHPKTMALLRDTSNPEYIEYTRCKRRRPYVPDAWDDIPRYDTYNHNWKRYRKTQFKKIVEM